MKIKISLFVLFCLFTGSEMLAQEVDITGTWTMYEMIWTTGDEVNTSPEDQLKAEGMKWTLSGTLNSRTMLSI